MKDNFLVLKQLSEIIKKNRNLTAKSSYTATLFSKGKVKIANKFGEESIETVTAFLAQDKKDIKEEVADLLYHLLVLLEYSDIPLQKVLKVLEKRMEKEKNID